LYVYVSDALRYFEMYNSQNDTWIKIETDLELIDPTKRNVDNFCSGLVSIDGLIYAIGGNRSKAIKHYNSQTRQWILHEEKLQTSTHVRTSAFVLDVNAKIYPENISHYYSCTKK